MGHEHFLVTNSLSVKIVQLERDFLAGIGTQLEGDDIQEAHSAFDEACHWLKPRYSTLGRIQVNYRVQLAMKCCSALTRIK